MLSIRSLPLLGLALAYLASGATAMADGHDDAQYDDGAVIADACLGCHGIPGYRNAYPSYRVPKLGGQHEEYLVLALAGYRDGTRAHPTMRAQAESLSDEDIRAVAQYFVGQGELEEGSPRGGARVARGEEKAAVCVACHGDDGISVTPNWPTLAGQHKDYLVESLRQYKNGQRSDPVMTGQVAALSDEDIEDLAAYYAAQPGLFTAQYGN